MKNELGPSTHMSLGEVISKNVNLILQNIRMKQSTLARHSGISSTTINQLLGDKSSLKWHDQHIENVAKALSVDASILLKRTSFTAKEEKKSQLNPGPADKAILDLLRMVEPLSKDKALSKMHRAETFDQIHVIKNQCENIMNLIIKEAEGQGS